MKKTNKILLLLNNPEVNRKLLHLVFALYPIFLGIVGERLAFWINLIFCLKIILGDNLLRYKLKHGKLQTLFYRKAELNGVKKFSGGFWIALSCLIMVSIFNKDTYIPAMLIIAFCDSLSSLIGKNFGKHRVARTTKSWEGFVGFIFGGLFVYLVSSFICGVELNIAIFIFSIIVSGLFELLAKIDDNVSISLSYCLCYSLLCFL